MIVGKKWCFPQIPQERVKYFFKLIESALQSTNSKLVDLNPLPFYLILNNKEAKLQESDLKKFIKTEEKVKLPADIMLTKINLLTDPLLIETEIRKIIIFNLLRKGCQIENFSSFFIDSSSQIGSNCFIGSGVIIKNSRIGKGTKIFANSSIQNSTIGKNVTILFGSLIFDSKVADNAQLGPYCHLRASVEIASGAKIGNFVEMKKTKFGAGSKAMHLSYLGDATIGKEVNIGAGTITCNYDGEKKHPTLIEDNVFVGSGVELVAPVKIRKNSYIGAGSTITQDVPENSLAIARQRQKNIIDWVKRRKKKPS